MTVNMEELISLQGGVTPICVLISGLVLANREDTYAVIILGLLYWVFLGLCMSSPSLFPFSPLLLPLLPPFSPLLPLSFSSVVCGVVCVMCLICVCV